MWKGIFILLFSAILSGEVSSERFIVRFGEGDEKLALEVLRLATGAREKVIETLGFAPEEKVVIFLAEGDDNFFEIQQGVPKWAVGTAYPEKKKIFLRHPDNIILRYTGLKRLITHEYTHIALGEAAGGLRVPRWLNEGLASYVGGERGFSAYTTIAMASLTGSLIPLADLKNSFPDGSGRAELAYAESYSFVSYLEKRYGPGALRRLLSQFFKTGNIQDATISAFGRELAAIEAEWMQRIKRRYNWIFIFSGGLGLWFIMTLIFIAGYIRKRITTKSKMKLWELTEESGYARDEEEDEPPTLH